MTALTHKENELHNRLIVAKFNLGQVEEELRRLREENEALRARLAQPEPEPVAKMRELLEVQGCDGNWNFDPYMQGMFNGMEMMMSLVDGRDPAFRKAPDKWLYTAPPQREWQGLTDEEILEEYRQSYGDDGNLTDIYFAHAIEAKLKEKNAPDL